MDGDSKESKEPCGDTLTLCIYRPRLPDGVPRRRVAYLLREDHTICPRSRYGVYTATEGYVPSFWCVMKTSAYDEYDLRRRRQRLRRKVIKLP